MAGNRVSESAAVDEDKLVIDDLLCFAVYSTGLAFNRVYKPLLDDLGLTYPQFLVMIALWTMDDQTVSGIGDHLSLESNTLTPLLKRLEAMDCLARVRDRNDERVVRLRLTAHGRALRAKAAPIRARIAEATGFSEVEIKRLRDDMQMLRGHLREAIA